MRIFLLNQLYKCEKRIPAWVHNPLPSRESQLHTLEYTKEFDVLIIGGGATGCGVALDSVSRGVALTY